MSADHDLSFAGVANAPDARRFLSYSSMSAFRRCQKLFWWQYVRNLAPVRRESYFRQGSLWHAGMEALYGPEERDPFAAMNAFCDEALAEAPDQSEAIALDRFTFSGLMRAYLKVRHTFSPADGAFRPLAAEKKFVLPLRHPTTGVRSRWYDLVGFFDSIVEDEAGIWILEHKTTGSSLDDFLQRTATDLQLSIYLNAAGELFGPDRVRGAIYNVARKPALRPMKDALIPTGEVGKDGEPKRKKAGRPETPEEFGDRVFEAAMEDPASYFRRERVYRNANALENAKAEAWQTAQDIRGREYFLRNYSECDRCAFASVCHEPNPYAEETLFRPRVPERPSTEAAAA